MKALRKNICKFTDGSRQTIYGNEQKVLFMRQMNLLQNDIIEDEVKVELNWIFKTFFYLAFMYFVTRVIGDYHEKYRMVSSDNKWLMGAFAIIFFIIPLLSMKCTSKGCYGGINCYFFSFYRNKLFPWKKFPDLAIYDLWFTYEILFGDACIPRFVVSNFDKLAELISRNTRIYSKTRQSFVDYVNTRKQQGITDRILGILRGILFIAILYGVFLLGCGLIILWRGNS